MDNGHIHATQTKAVRCFQTQQSTTDDDRIFFNACCLDHSFRVMNITIADDTIEFIARHRQNKWRRSGSNHKRSYGVQLPSSVMTWRLIRSILDTAHPIRKSIPASSYQDTGLSTISLKSCSPANTGDKRIRL